MGEVGSDDGWQLSRYWRWATAMALREFAGRVEKGSVLSTTYECEVSVCASLQDVDLERLRLGSLDGVLDAARVESRRLRVSLGG